jgi:tRNA(fMet)-specific endonuclease VapC
MTTRFAVDTTAVVDLMRAERPKPSLLLHSDVEVFLPLPVLGELYVGALSSLRPQHHFDDLTRVSRRWKRLMPNEETARAYAELRVRMHNVAPLSMSKTNDYWIAALCTQHELPLLTNDRGFDHIPSLTVIHW